MNDEGEGSDPFDDPFGQNPTPIHLAFALQAAKQADQRLQAATELVEDQLATHGHHEGFIEKSRRKSVTAQLAELHAHHRTVHSFLTIARQEATDSGDPGECPHAILTANALGPLVDVFNGLMKTAADLGDDPDTPSVVAAPLPAPAAEPAMQASQAIQRDLAAYVKKRRATESGDLVVVKATAGIGKTHAMIDVAISEQLAYQRVAYAVRTKDQLTGNNPELIERFTKRSPLGKLSLAVITGRDATNCNEWKSVEAIMKQGYSPGQAACPKCDFFPGNAEVYGWSPCDYYAERMRAHNLTRNAKGPRSHHPLILTTQASVIAAHLTQGGRWGDFWASDLILFDEDCTEAFEIDITLDELQCMFRSTVRENKHANAAAILFAMAMKLGADERAAVKANDFKKPGEKKRNTHPVHSRFDSNYTGDELRLLLERALLLCQQTHAMPELTRVLADVADSQGFFVKPGSLINMTSVEELTQENVPPKALSDIAGAIHAEISHHLDLSRIAYRKVLGRDPAATSVTAIIAELEKHTDIEPRSYSCRLECLPADTSKGRKKDEWRFVVRRFTPLANHKSTIVVGDAYAQRAHYEQLFLRSADEIRRVSTLHPDTTITRLHHDLCTIGQLGGKGRLNDILQLAETRLVNTVRPGDRLLVYGHLQLKTKVDRWLKGVGERLQLAEWKYEHWWGGRGKDQYGGWEHLYCISDPILNLSGITHVANARALRDSVRAKTDDEKLEHGKRLVIANAGGAKNNTLHALAESHPRIVLEHERMNVSEMTQAMHRGRPVHHPANIVVVGRMELGTEIVGQVTNVIESASHLANRTGAVLIEPSHDEDGYPMVDAFVTTGECRKLIRAILNHYGVFSVWFLHALLTPKSISGGSLKDNLNRTATYQRLDTVPGPQSTDVNEPGMRSMHGIARTEPAPRERQLSMTPIDRVWLPPLKWKRTLSAVSRPVRRALDALKTDQLLGCMTAPMPSWRKSSAGRRPSLYFDPTLLDGTFNASSAVAEYLKIVENQYGSERDGRLVRPNFDPAVPRTGLSMVPF